MTSISIVVPVFNEEKSIEILYKKITDVLKRIKSEYEIIFVDDGSNDKSFDILKKIHEKDRKAKIIKFRKNFGQSAALDAGFKNAKGRIIITLDADLQNDPEDIPRLLKKMEEGFDVVSGWRHRRKDPFKKKIVSKISNLLVRMLGNVNIHDSGCTLKAYRKECFKNFDLYKGVHRFIPISLKRKGFKIGEIKIMHHSRKYGKTKYGIKRLPAGFFDLIMIRMGWINIFKKKINYKVELKLF